MHFKIFKTNNRNSTSNFYYKASITLLSKQGKDTHTLTHAHTDARTLACTHTQLCISQISINANVLNKIPINLVKAYIKKIIHNDQVGFILEMVRYM